MNVTEKKKKRFNSYNIVRFCHLVWIFLCIGCSRFSTILFLCHSVDKLHAQTYITVCTLDGARELELQTPKLVLAITTETQMNQYAKFHIFSKRLPQTPSQIWKSCDSHGKDGYATQTLREWNKQAFSLGRVIKFAECWLLTARGKGKITKTVP